MRFGELAFHISDRVDDSKTTGVATYVGLEHLDSGSLKIKRRDTLRKYQLHKENDLFDKTYDYIRQYY